MCVRETPLTGADLSRGELVAGKGLTVMGYCSIELSVDLGFRLACRRNGPVAQRFRLGIGFARV